MLETLIIILVAILAGLGAVFIAAAIAVAVDKKKKKPEDKKVSSNLVAPSIFLKECPCCGGTAKVKIIDNHFFVKCSSCGLASGVKEEITDAAASWNRRTEVAMSKKLYIKISALKEELDKYKTQTGLPVAELVRRHTPRKPLPEQRYYGIGRCPLCDVIFTDDSTKYCGNCGQAIDWGEGEE